MSAYNLKKARVPKGKTRTEKTVLVEEGAGAKMPDAVGPSESEPTHTSWSRLDHLYRITKLLLKCENMDKTLNEILAVVSNTLPLRSAILIDETKGRAQVSVWLPCQTPSPKNEVSSNRFPWTIRKTNTLDAAIRKITR